MIHYLAADQNQLVFFFGFLGVVLALAGGSVGSAYGIAKSSLGILAAGRRIPGGVIKNLIPVVMAGMLGIYGLIIAVFIVSTISQNTYSAYKGFAHLWSGGVVGLSCVPVGFCTGICGEYSTYVTGNKALSGQHQQQLFVSMVLLQVFAGACGLYALIVGLLLAVQS
uniref:V-type proton ATPase proteolipid subunit n=1 Tax=Arcella intermedia TaxID=1963864 RepID=A0A6B2LN47_9EUKA